MTEADIAALPLCGRLPAIPTLPQVFGVLYVIDGAALGERIATIHLGGHNLGISPSQGGSFFSSLSASHDPFLDTCPQDFIAMAQAVEEAGHQDLVIRSAIDTLECLERWLDHRKQSHVKHSMHILLSHGFRQRITLGKLLCSGDDKDEELFKPNDGSSVCSVPRSSPQGCRDVET
jgi:hypothetical protein